MDKKTRKRPARARIPEELARLSPDVIRGFLERFVRNSYSVHLPAHHASSNVFGVSCARTDLLMLSGRDATDATGSVSIRIDDLLCGAITEDLSPAFLVMLSEPNFVVTPLGATPAFATVQTRSTPQNGPSGVFLIDRAGNPVQRVPIHDVTVDVLTWNPDGSAAGNTSFSWICTLEAARAISIGG
jgi:hypothetical protein